MRLKQKILASTALLWTVFLIALATFLYFFLPAFYLVGVIIFGIAVYFVLFFLINHFFIKRVEFLNLQFIQHKMSQHLQIDSNNDEITAIASQINKIIDAFHVAEERLARPIPELDTDHMAFFEKELTMHKDRLAQLAHYDNLTALPNRIFFNEMLNKTLSHASRHNKILAILFIDLDHFRQINDALGYKVGNQVLKDMANRFSAVIRNGDIIARLGGDEFIILLNDINNPKFASPIAEKILQECAKPITVADNTFHMTASIGICIFPNDGSTLEDLQKRADLALYKAKQAGGGVYQYYSKEMTLEAHKHIKLNSALRKAIQNKEFILHYQPKFNLITGAITGVEALVRWINPEIGLVNPIQFIPQAEESGVITAIGEWVLEEACRANKAWQDKGLTPITMAVNLAPAQFNHPEFVNVIKNCLSQSGLDPAFLELEISETTMMDAIHIAKEKLEEIKKIGVRVCIDDFGTGNTSISYLKQFPIDVLKIDQSFIKGIPGNQNDLAITSAIIALAHNLGMQVVAEGVETIEQLQFLGEHNCDSVQGYYFSRPLPEQKVVLQLEQTE